MLTVKTTSVFYDQEGYPFKDAQRTVRYPITGGTFAGSHNTKQIRFYVRDIGGTTNITWVVLSKLPNGKLGYEICSNVQPDSELGEYYLLFDLSAYYTSVKGDLYLALRGYQGEVTFEDDDSDGVYNIVGDPLIEVTGTIKLSINYSPMVNTGTQVLPSDVDRILAALSNYLKLENAVIFTHDITTLNASDYDVGQVILEYKNNLANFYYVAEVSQTKVFYFATFETLRSNEVTAITLSGVQTINLLLGGKIQKVGNDILITNNSHTLKLDVNGVLTLDNDVLLTQTNGDNRYIRKYEEPIEGTITLFMLYALFGNKPIYFSYDDNWYFCRLETGTFSTISFEFENTITKGRYAGRASQSTTLSSILNSSSQYYQPYATEDYVDSALQEFLQKEYDKVDTAEYPTLNDFLARSTGEEGYIYLYPIDTSDDTKGYYQYIWENNAWVSLGSTQIDLSGYVEKTSSANKVYGTNELGAQTTYTVDDFYEGNIARRDTDGSITVPLTPTQNGHASSKKYVDDEINDLSNEVDNKLEEKANVDGNYPTLTAGLADNLTPYSEDSGAEQTNPFISNGTGTNNNSEIVTVGDYAQFKEKQGNTLVVNQFIDGFSGFSGYNATVSVVGDIATITHNSDSNAVYFKGLGQNIYIAGHKYLVKCTVKNNISGKILWTNNVYSITYITESVSENWTTKYFIFTYIGPEIINPQFQLLHTDGQTDDSFQVKRDMLLIDLTQMFNGDIPQDLLDHPDHFSWYYNGSLAYNTGSLENANGVKLVSTGRNIYNSNETYNVVIPNKPFFASKTTTITYYDKDKNSIGTESVSAGNTFTTPSNCFFINSSVSAITITPYYTDQEGGEGYKDNNTPIEYPYEEPYVVDTGSEVLRSAGSIKDYKEPNGTIHRLVKNVIVDGVNVTVWYKGTASNGNNYYLLSISDAKKAVNNQTAPNTTSSRFEAYSLDAVRYGATVVQGFTANVGDGIWLAMGPSSDFDTATKVNTWLQSNPISLNYELATPTTEQGTPFAENLPINDYGMLYWLDSSNNLVGIPQGAKIFYPTNYKGFVDDLYSKVKGNSDDYALNSELNAKFETYLKSLTGYDASATQVLKNVEGTLTWVTEGE